MLRGYLSLLLVLGLGGQPAQADESLTVFAAASMAGVLEEIARPFAMPTIHDPDHKPPVAFSYGGSGAMARQVASGAPADVVILASPLWMGWLVEQGVVAEESVKPVARNSLVVIGPLGALPLKDAGEIRARLDGQRLAMGQRDAVPAGLYAREWLEKAGQWDALSDQLAETDNVRAALALVARGEAPLGVVYASDALQESRVSVVLEVPFGNHSPILYPAAALTPEGRVFLSFLTRDDAQGILADRGFGGVEP